MLQLIIADHISPQRKYKLDYMIHVSGFMKSTNIEHPRLNEPRIRLAWKEEKFHTELRNQTGENTQKCRSASSSILARNPHSKYLATKESNLDPSTSLGLGHSEIGHRAVSIVHTRGTTGIMPSNHILNVVDELFTQ